MKGEETAPILTTVMLNSFELRSASLPASIEPPRPTVDGEKMDPETSSG
jgi:hypothetical protein